MLCISTHNAIYRDMWSTYGVCMECALKKAIHGKRDRNVVKHVESKSKWLLFCRRHLMPLHIVFGWIKIVVFRFKYHWNSFTKLQLTIPIIGVDYDSALHTRQPERIMSQLSAHISVTWPRWVKHHSLSMGYTVIILIYFLVICRISTNLLLDSIVEPLA